MLPASHYLKMQCNSWYNQIMLIEHVKPDECINCIICFDGMKDLLAGSVVNAWQHLTGQKFFTWPTIKWAWTWHTVFGRINAPGAEAQNKLLTLSDLNDIHYVTPWVPEHWVLKIWLGSVQWFFRNSQSYSKVGERVYSSRRVYSAKYGNQSEYA